MARHRQSSKIKAEQKNPELPPSQELIPCVGCSVVHPPVFIPTEEQPTPPVPSCKTMENPTGCPLRQYMSEAEHLELEIGPGMGRFILAHSENNPYIQMIGIEKETVRVAHVDIEARKRGIKNLRLVCGEALPFLIACVPPASVEKLYIFYPDPWPKRKHHKNRLFQKNFVDAVWACLKPGGTLNAVTGHAEYVRHMQEVMADEKRFEQTEAFTRTENERTDFELRFTALGMEAHTASWKKL